MHIGFGDSSINSVGGDAGKLLPDGRTDGRTTDGQSDGHNPLIIIKDKSNDAIVITNDKPNREQTFSL